MLAQAERLQDIKDRGFTVFWLVWEKADAYSFAKKQGLNISYVCIQALDADLLYVYADFNRLPARIQKHIEGKG